jgi:hypothetical protein
MKRLTGGILPLMIVGFVVAVKTVWQPLQFTVSNLPDLGPAPVWMNENWLNTDMPLRLENLRGKVVLIDMWTFG